MNNQSMRRSAVGAGSSSIHLGHRMVVAALHKDGAVVDRYETPFGIRTIRFDPNEGFFLNGKHVVLKGSNNHQDQAGVGTEETTTQQTRGVYFDERPRAHLAPVLNGSSGGNCEVGWTFYAARPFLAGLFYWTGFDYRGEPTPFGYPAISSQFGILDTCGFPKDCFYYLKAWWTDQPVLHVLPHWNWPGKGGQTISVWAYSNSDEVELLLNGKSLGRKAMTRNSHLEWGVAYEPGTLLARGFKSGQEILTQKVETARARVYRGSFEVPQGLDNATLTLLLSSFRPAVP